MFQRYVMYLLAEVLTVLVYVFIFSILMFFISLYRSNPYVFEWGSIILAVIFSLPLILMWITGEFKK